MEKLEQMMAERNSMEGPQELATPTSSTSTEHPAAGASAPFTLQSSGAPFKKTKIKNCESSGRGCGCGLDSSLINVEICLFVCFSCWSSNYKEAHDLHSIQEGIQVMFSPHQIDLSLSFLSPLPPLPPSPPFLRIAPTYPQSACR